MVGLAISRGSGSIFGGPSQNPFVSDISSESHTPRDLTTRLQATIFSPENGGEVQPSLTAY